MRSHLSSVSSAGPPPPPPPPAAAAAAAACGAVHHARSCTARNCMRCRSFTAHAGFDPLGEAAKRERVETEVRSLTRHEVEEDVQKWERAAAAARAESSAVSGAEGGEEKDNGTDNANGDGATEYGGPRGPEPTRFGDWEQKGRCSDF